MSIELQGAREHNLQDLSLTLPHNELVVLTGVSGSGKSTLAFDILFAEGQRRYLESLAPYVRQYMKILERPDVDIVTGLSPTVAIEQRISHASRRSTVATLTEIYHFLRLLYSKLGTQHCPGCGRPLAAQTQAAIVEQVRARYGRRPATVLAPKVLGRKGFHKEVLERAVKKGFTEARIDGTLTRLTPGMALSPLPRAHHRAGHREAAGRRPRGLHRPQPGGGRRPPQRHRRPRPRRRLQPARHLPGLRHRAGAARPAPVFLQQPAGRLPGLQGARGDRRRRGSGRSGRSAPVCRACSGSRLKPQALAVEIDGPPSGTWCSSPPPRCRPSSAASRFPRHQKPVAEPVVSEILTRLALLNRLGLSYLSLGRSGNTLSGGEAQRVRLAAQLGSNLTGVCYILDEPTIGLHPRDNRVLVDALKTLRDRGNTIIVVEHDEETIRAADTIIDLGPGAGRDGGTGGGRRRPGRRPARAAVGRPAP